MKVLQRLKDGWNKLIFCYKVTNNLSSFLSLIWFTKLYRLSKRTNISGSYSNKLFSISLKAFPDRTISLRIYAGDIDVFYEIFLKKIYELSGISDKQVIVDAGANVGFAALYFLKQMPQATIYCIEPDPDNFIFLQKNLKAEIESGKVKTIMAALSDKDGVMNLKNNCLKYNSNLVEAPSEDSITVVTYTVGTFLKKFVSGDVNLFKIDIEGAEKNIFESDVSWLGKVDEVLIEFHSKKIEEMCFEKLVSQNFYHLPAKSRENTDVFLFRKSV